MGITGARRKHRRVKADDSVKVDLVATMDAVVADIEVHRMRFAELSVSALGLSHRDPEHVKSVIPEGFVRQWLKRVPSLDEQCTPYCNGGNYELKRSPSGNVLVYRGNRANYEFDAVFLSNDFPIIVEVKAHYLEPRETFGGYHRAILQMQAHLEMAQQVYGKVDVGLLLFYPFHCNPLAESELIPTLMNRLPSVRCVDSGYSKRELDKQVKKHSTGRAGTKKSIHDRKR